MFTYTVTGPRVTFLGRGGFHELGNMEHTYKPDFYSFDSVFQVEEEDRADGECFYMFHVHSLKEMDDVYLNNDPLIFALIVAAVFLFTTLVLITYDYVVKRNERIIMEKAVQTSNIVSSLFPTAVRKRLFDMDKKNDPAGMKTSEAPKDPMQALTRQESTFSGSSSDDPVADLYENCTVLFADIAGFTKWSSTRSPVEVFKLLERLYEKFDRCGRSRQVFKVETIGGALARIRVELINCWCIFMKYFRIIKLCLTLLALCIHRLLCGRDRLTRASRGPCRSYGTVCL